MKESIIQRTDSWLLCLILLVSMMAMFYVGWRYSRKRPPMTGVGTVEGSLFALLGLMLAFTFGMSGSRYESRRMIIVDEANDIGTAILRADLYEEAERQGFRKDFAAYLEGRISVYKSGGDTGALKAARVEVSRCSQLLWQRAARLSRIPANLVASNQMIPALNNMFDIATSRTATMIGKVPELILVLLFVLSVACSFFAGVSAPTDKKLNWLTIVGFGILTMMVIFVILDLDRPNRGIIRIEQNVDFIIALRGMFS